MQLSEMNSGYYRLKRDSILLIRQSEEKRAIRTSGANYPTDCGNYLSNILEVIVSRAYITNRG